MVKILIGSPIRRRPNILHAFLDGLKRIDISGIEVDFFFVDDNDDIKSKQLLKQFATQVSKNHKITIKPSEDIIHDKKQVFANKENDFHGWNGSSIKRVAAIKDAIICEAKEQKYDFLFLLDSDILLQPQSLKHLISRNVDIVSNIWWTDWNRLGVATPFVWYEDENNIIPHDLRPHFDAAETRNATAGFFEMLRVPGIYEVGGLGAATLISKKAINRGVNFSKIKNLSFYGEDRDFCVRAVALGLKLYIDTVFPAFHIYYDDLLKKVSNFIKYGYREQDILLTNTRPLRRSSKFSKFALLNFKTIRDYYQIFQSKQFAKKRIVKTESKLTLSVIINGNESSFFSGENFNELRTTVNKIIIFNNSANPKAEQICRELLGKNMPVFFIEKIKNKSMTKQDMNKSLWNAAVKNNSDWILRLDDDETLTNDAIIMLPKLMSLKKTDVFRFKTSGEGNGGIIWDGYNNFENRLVRYQPNFHYKFLKRDPSKAVDCFPNNIDILQFCNYPISISHLYKNKSK